jgi:hypothetical protein
MIIDKIVIIIIIITIGVVADHVLGSTTICKCLAFPQSDSGECLLQYFLLFYMTSASSSHDREGGEASHCPQPVV